MDRRLVVAGFLVSSGCGGGGGLDTASGGILPEPPAAQISALDALTARLDGLEFTRDLPSSGEALYVGYAGLTAAGPGRETLFVTGSAEFTARFEAGTISGRMGGFAAMGGASVSGDIAVQDGTVGVTGFSGDLDGVFRAWAEDHAVGGRVAGAFLGAGAEGLAGVVDAPLSGGGTLTGEVWAER